MAISDPVKLALMEVPGYTMSGDSGLVKFTRPVYTMPLSAGLIGVAA